MPIYMDRHILPGISAHEAAEAHRMDLVVQDEYGCRCMTYWVDEERGSAFCLIDAPSKEAVIKMHDRSHGLIPHQIIEMNSKAVMSFLGRIEDPEVTDLTDIHTFLRSRLVDTMGSEIQYVIRDHGPEIPGRLEEQLNSYTGGCDVYHCSDVQFAVHKP